MAQGERARGPRHIIVTAVPQTYASLKLESNSDTEQAAKMRDDQDRESPAANVRKQIAQDRLTMIQGNRLRRVI